MELGGVSSQAGMAQSLMKADNNSNLVVQTLDKLNGTSTQSIHADDEAQRMILSAATGIGSNLDTTV